MKPFRLLLLLPLLFVSCAPTQAPDSSTALSAAKPAAAPFHGSVSVGMGTDPDYMRRSHVEM